VLLCQRIQLYTRFDEPASDDVRARYRELVRQRAAGKPVAYLVGRREFFSLSFLVTPDVLIPRPETEFLVLRLRDLVKQAAVQDVREIADVGTGSGILAVCAARYAQPCRVTAVDISPAALAVARRNAAEHGVADQIEFVESDLLGAIVADRQFDFILSNPPYIRSDEMVQLPRDVRDYEPRQALEAGPHGTEVIERLIPQAADRLNPGGWLLIEVSPQIEPAVAALLAADTRFEPHPTQRDLAQQPRVVQARRK
jgi:release factor glutamine methyltransferase